MADTNERYELAKLIDDIIDCAVHAGACDARKGFGAFTESDSMSMTAMRRSISQKRAQIIGHFDESNATPPADAALAEMEAWARNKSVEWNSRIHHYRSNGAYDVVAVIRKDQEMLTSLLAAALRARAVPDEALDLLRKVATSDVMSDRSGVMFVHLAIDRDVIDDINAMLAASKEAGK